MAVPLVAYSTSIAHPGTVVGAMLSPARSTTGAEGRHVLDGSEMPPPSRAEDAPGSQTAGRRRRALTPGQRTALAAVGLGALLVVIGILVGVWLADGPLRAWLVSAEATVDTTQPFEPPRPVAGAKAGTELMAAVRADYPGFVVRSATMLKRDETAADGFWRVILDSTTARGFSIEADYDRSIGVRGDTEPWRSSDAFFSSNRYRSVATSFMPRFVKDHPDEIVVLMAETTMFDGRRAWTVDTVTYNGVTRQHVYEYRGGWVQTKQ
jgi:hypothetical protein